MCYYFHFYSLYTKLWRAHCAFHTFRFEYWFSPISAFFLFIFCSLHGWNGKPKITTEQKNKLNQICTRVTHSFPYIKFINLFWHRCFRSNKFNMKLCDVMHLHSAYSSDWHISKLSSRTHVMQQQKKAELHIRFSYSFTLVHWREKKMHFLFQYVDVVRSIRLQPKFNE